MSVTCESAEQRPYIKQARCKTCGLPFVRGDKAWRNIKAYVEEIQTNDFRGDDEVNFYHTTCFKTKGA